uniref:Uncharacterized protein n=1 Tax=Moniliophthora roreri TaxID=221103 RepID=A0A0W0G2W3_MONRR
MSCSVVQRQFAFKTTSQIEIGQILVLMFNQKLPKE